jgi:hypothetical protein
MFNNNNNNNNNRKRVYAGIDYGMIDDDDSDYVFDRVLDLNNEWSEYVPADSIEKYNILQCTNMITQRLRSMTGTPYNSTTRQISAAVGGNVLPPNIIHLIGRYFVKGIQKDAIDNVRAEMPVMGRHMQNAIEASVMTVDNHLFEFYEGLGNLSENLKIIDSGTSIQCTAARITATARNHGIVRNLRCLKDNIDRIQQFIINIEGSIENNEVMNLWEYEYPTFSNARVMSEANESPILQNPQDYWSSF